jgi:hypothetical protein
MTFSGDNAAEEQNHADGGGKQRKVGKKRQTWVLRNGGFQFGGYIILHRHRQQHRRGRERRERGRE